MSEWSGRVLKVVKKDGTRVPFDRSNLKDGLEKACWKRPVSDTELERVITTIENDIDSKFESEVESRFLGEQGDAHAPRNRSGSIRAFRQRIPAV